MLDWFRRMKNPFFMIKVHSQRAIRIAVICSVIAAITTPIGVYLMALKHAGSDVHGKEIPILATGIICAPFTFIVVGYLVVGMARIVEGLRKKDSN